MKVKALLVPLVAAVALAIPAAASAATYTQGGYAYWIRQSDGAEKACTGCSIRIVNNHTGAVTWATTNSNGYWSYNFTYSTEYHLYLEYSLGYCSYDDSYPNPDIIKQPVGGNIFIYNFGDPEESGCPDFPEGI